MKRRWRAASESAQKKGLTPESHDYWHYITMDILGEHQDFRCTCRGFTNHHRCWHVTRAREFMENGSAEGIELISGLPELRPFEFPPKAAKIKDMETQIKIAQTQRVVDDVNEMLKSESTDDHILDLSELLKW